MTLRYLPLAATILLSMTACSELNTLTNDVGSAINKVMTPQSQQAQSQTKVNNNAATKKPDDVTKLFDWMENGCQGWGTGSSGLLSSIIDQESRNRIGGTPKVTPRSSWAQPYANMVENATVATKVFDSTEGYAYVITFNNATYRGMPLKSYEFWNAHESDYVIQNLYFKDDSFMALKPRFKSAYDEMYDDYEQAQFNAAEKSITCY
ncbi:hypothetical protein [Psychrobacter sp. FDAARGOS_221]|uniref:hypothetical protein n=1 Tax=Psychrobacter sp. FDAARGOS_221 TaxID=1975705 RepID=UPI000BB56BBE|nr:hypothetical protein [Psychrobacter sp. FDAARGOS_221]PNK61241.1 hypothetical protein A6J60_010390 [Psychrobacter sp. FDAARGOS_221]